MNDLAKKLKDVLEDKAGAAYIGGGLCLNDASVYISERTVTWSDRNENSPFSRELTDEEMKLACLLYLKHKTPNHAFYELASRYIEQCVVCPILFGANSTNNL